MITFSLVEIQAFHRSSITGALGEDRHLGFHCVMVPCSIQSRDTGAGAKPRIFDTKKAASCSEQRLLPD